MAQTSFIAAFTQKQHRQARLPLLTVSSLRSEHGGQRSHLYHLLPSIPSDEVGQTPEQRGGNQDSSVDLH